ncbi:MAG: flippase [Anaerolineales bacterium]|nr:flippase [Anaerolineales bacterium]
MSNHAPDLDDFAVGAGIGLIGRFGGRFISVLAGIIAARVLGPAIFGVYALGWTMFRLLELITPLGFDAGVIKYGSGVLGRDQQALKGFIVYSLGLSLLFSVGLGICIYLLAPWLASHLFLKPDIEIVLRLFALAVPFSGLVGVMAAASRLTHNMVYSIVVQDLGQPFLGLAILGIFCWLGLTLRRVVVADLLSYVLVTALAFFILWNLFPAVFKRRVISEPPGKAFYSFSIYAALSALMGTFVFWVDRLFVGTLLTSSEVGYYQSAAQISVVFAVVVSGFNRILMPVFSTLHHANRIEQLEEMYRVGTKWSIYVSAPIILLLLLSSRDVLVLLYGQAYSSAGSALVLLLAGQLVNLATGSIGPLLLVGGFQRIAFYLSGGVLIGNVLMCWILVPEFGIAGAAVANSISVALLNITALFIIKVKMKVWPYDRRYLKGFLAILVASCVAILLKRFLLLPEIFEILLIFAVLTSTFAAVLVLLGLDAEDRTLIRTLLARLTPRHGLRKME